MKRLLDCQYSPLIFNNLRINRQTTLKSQNKINNSNYKVTTETKPKMALRKRRLIRGKNYIHTILSLLTLSNQYKGKESRIPKR